MPTIRTILPQQKNDAFPLLRVAAYCRVSSDSDDQAHSFGAQTEYYTKLIGENPLWTLADIYADEGITGTSMKKRDEFNRMIADCKRGKIDRILTKSVSRFARNTVDCLDTVRMLSDLGISVLFEKEQIDTAKMSSEVILGMISTQAQDESVSISGNMRWSYEKRMKNGDFICCYTPYGYRWVDKQLTVIPEEAEIVKRIYTQFLSGIGMVQIARQLDSEGVTHRNGYHWTAETIDYILHNERYTGDALLQKFYTTATFPARQKENHGERSMYYVENSHTPIISKNEFTAVQELIQRRRKEREAAPHHPLTGVMRCSQCGHPFRRITSGRTPYWKCARYVKQKTACKPFRVNEEDVQAALYRAERQICLHPELIAATIRYLERADEQANGSQTKVYEIDRQIAEIAAQVHLLTQLQTSGILNAADFAEQTGRLSSQITSLRSERNAILRRDAEGELADLKELLDAINDSDVVDADAVVRPFLVKINVRSETEIDIQLKGSLVLPERLPLKKRR